MPCCACSHWSRRHQPPGKAFESRLVLSPSLPKCAFSTCNVQRCLDKSTTLIRRKRSHGRRSETLARRGDSFLLPRCASGKQAQRAFALQSNVWPGCVGASRKSRSSSASSRRRGSESLSKGARLASLRSQPLQQACIRSPCALSRRRRDEVAAEVLSLPK